LFFIRATFVSGTWGGPYLEACVPLIVGPLVILVMEVCGLNPNLSDVVEIAAASLVTAVGVLLTRKAARHDAVLIEISMSYLLHGGRAMLDQLLRKMIAGRWKREQLKPGDALFKVLRELCRKGDWELRRRISEALLVLGEINPKRTLEIVTILREDWDENRWKGDLRRRAIEGLVNPPPTNGIALIHNLSPRLVEPLLKLKGSDDGFTAIAMLEALGELEVTDASRAVRLRADLLSFADQNLTTEERKGLHALADLLQLAKNGNVLKVAERISELSQSDGLYVRLIAARNVWRLFGRLPDRALTIMEHFSQPSEHKYVRRAIAKERSVDFIIRMITGQQYRARGELLLRTLVSDPDTIIRETAFDKAETLRDVRDDFLAQ